MCVIRIIKISLCLSKLQLAKVYTFFETVYYVHHALDEFLK